VVVNKLGARRGMCSPASESCELHESGIAPAAPAPKGLDCHSQMY